MQPTRKGEPSDSLASDALPMELLTPEPSPEANGSSSGNVPQGGTRTMSENMTIDSPFPIIPPPPLEPQIEVTAGEQILMAATVSQPVYWNAGVFASVTNYGCSATLSCFRPKVETGDFSYLAAFVSNNDGSHAEQTIMAGWIRSPTSRFGTLSDTDPYACQLFVYFSTVGSPSANGDRIQGFNDTVEGWVSTPGAAFLPGTSFLPATIIDGPQGSIDLKFQLTGNKWNLRLNGTIIGYYPTSLFTVDRRDPAAPLLADTSRTLADHANRVGFYGVVYDSKSGGLTSTDMGSGKYPEEGYEKSAFCFKMQYQPQATAINATMADADSSWGRLVDDPLRYDCLVSWKSTSWWRSYMYIGGPGCEATGWSAWDSVGGTFAPGSHVTTLSRRPGVIDLFVIGLDGRVYTSWWDNENWSGVNDSWRLLDWGGGTTFLPGSKVAAIARTPDNLDIFAIGVDLKIYTARWTDGHDWYPWKDISPNQTFQGPLPLLAAVSRHQGQMDVFILDSGGNLHTSWWTDSVTDWTGLDRNWDIRGTVSAVPAQQDLIVLSKGPQSIDVIASNSALDIDVRFVTSFVCSSWTETDGWSTFTSIGAPPSFPLTGPPRAAAVVRSSARVELFAFGADSQIYTSNWTPSGLWSGVEHEWQKVGEPLPILDGAISPLVVLARDASSLDLFAGGIDGRVYTTSLEPSSLGVESMWTVWAGIGGEEPGITVPFALAACARNKQSMAVLACGKAGKVWVAEWIDLICGPRPFYCMAHNPNNKSLLEKALQQGANAIGPDVNKSRDSGKLVIAHGAPGVEWPPGQGSDSDPDLVGYLQDLHNLAIQYPQLALVAFDCKQPVQDKDTGWDILQAIRTHLTKDLNLDIVLSVPSVGGTPMFDRIRHTLGPREAIAIDEDDDIAGVVRYFNAIQARSHAMYGNGISIDMAVSTKLPVLEWAAGLRAGSAPWKSAYGWTMNTEDMQREGVRIGLDGLMADTDGQLERLLTLVRQDNEVRRLVRLATREDRALAGPSAAYELVVRTGNSGALGAGANVNLTFVLRGQSGAAKKVVNTAQPGRMEVGATNYVVIQSRDLGDLVDITVRNDMAHDFLGNSVWRCETIRVLSARYGVDRTATFRADIDANPVTRLFL
jgi:hypothetical protein